MTGDCGMSRGVAGISAALPADLAEEETAKTPHVAENDPATTRHYPQMDNEGEGVGQAESRVITIDAADTRAGEDRRLGRVRPSRAVPRDFVERWPLFGWEGAKDEWRAHSRTIARWVDECGRDRMVLARKAYKQAEREIQGRARRKRYVLGQTLTPKR